MPVSAIKEIIIITPQWFNHRDYNRFGVQLLRDSGYRVQIWDLGQIVFPEMVMNYKPHDFIKEDAGLKRFTSISQAREAIQRLEPGSVVLSLIGHTKKTWPVHEFLRVSNAYSGYLSANALPQDLPRAEQKIVSLKQSFSQLVNKGPSFFLKLPFKAVCYLFRKFMISLSGKKELEPPCPDFILAGGAFSLSSALDQDQNIQKIYAHTMDYDYYLNNPKAEPGNKTIVMLDENCAFHPEFKIYDTEAARPEVYYGMLNQFFQYLENMTGWRVIIAGHPRTEPEQLEPYLYGREIFYGNTVELVRNSNLVLGHASTSFNFCNLYAKPALFITMVEIEHISGVLSRRMAAWFGAEVVDLEQGFSVDLKKVLHVNHRAYANYRNAYIKKTGTPEQPLFKIFTDEIENRLTGC